jgi:myosin heavy subunit
VACPTLEFADNSAVMALMASKPSGLLSLINEEVIVPNSSDENLLQKAATAHKDAATFRRMPRAQGEGFIVAHYAGPVGYHIEGFVEKNRDAVPGELSQLLGTSSTPLIAALFQGAASDGADGGGHGAKHQKTGGGARGRSGGGGGRRAVALAGQFADSLDALMGVIKRTTPHFVRCVKPNTELAPNSFSGEYIMRQLKEMGMVHVVRARKQGYAHRYPFDAFISRYGYLMQGRALSDAAAAPFYQSHLGSSAPSPSERRGCTCLLATMVSEGALENCGWAVGTGKVFLKEAQQQQLEVEREAFLRKVVIEQLEKAISARDLSALESAIAAAVEVHRDHDVHSASASLTHDGGPLVP